MTNRIFFVFFFLLLPLIFFSQNNINKYRKKERHGQWTIYQDSTNKIIDNTGKYRKGIPKGTWKYYDSNERLIKTEKHIFRRTYIRFYHSNGEIKKKGKAKTVINDQLIHYFYFGNWYEYDTTGRLSKKIFYKEGHRISEISYETVTGKRINDTLAKIIRQLNTDIYKYSDSILNAESTFGKSSKEYQRYVSLSNLNALKALDELDKIISTFGYPGKTLVGSDHAIVFSIISSAGIHYKEKYYDLIIGAANKKELDWSDVAYFVDKVKVAKKEKQVFGTQYKIENNRIIYYPVEDKSMLNSRRKNAGLEETDIQLIDDTASY
jgi:hypothetical protein